MTSRAVVALGIGQCVNWGVLYYAFAVLVLPLERELGVATWVVTGAFSLSLLVSAALAPGVGRWGDRGRGPLVMQAGGFIAAALLTAWALIPTVTVLYVAWAGLGLCMAATLYEPAFVIVGRAYGDAAQRLRALAAVTLFGGLASTIFLPFTAFLVTAVGWRGAVLVLAAILASSTCITSAFVLRGLPASSAGPASEHPAARLPDERPASQRFLFVATMFAVTSFASAAFTANLIPALAERGISAGHAATLGGVLGVMQLPGRALLMNGGRAMSPSRLLTVSLVLQALGLGSLAATSSLLVVGCGIAVFAVGAGLATVVRPHLVQTAFGEDRAGHLNGRLARSQQLARAAGPILVAWIAVTVGYGTVFVLLASLFALLAVASQRLSSAIASIETKRSHHDRTSSTATIIG